MVLIIVVKKIFCVGILVWDKIVGFINKMYDIVKKVVRLVVILVWIVVLCFFSLKNFFILKLDFFLFFVILYF